MSTVGGSRSPWWLTWAVVGVIVFAPGFVITIIDKAGASLEAYGDRLPDTTDAPAGTYEPPCDTQAVLDALGMTVQQYQESRGLTVDGWVGPQTATSLCAEELDVPTEGTNS